MQLHIIIHIIEDIICNCIEIIPTLKHFIRNYILVLIVPTRLGKHHAKQNVRQNVQQNEEKQNIDPDVKRNI